MRTVNGLIIVLFMLGPIWMGILFNADAPLLEDGSSISGVDQASPENHGTRSPPSNVPTYVNLYFHRTGNAMNTSDIAFIPAASFQGPGSITFTLQDPLINDLLVEDPTGWTGMVAHLLLSGTGWLIASVYDNDENTLVGSGTHGSQLNRFEYEVPTFVDVLIPFETVWGHDYTFGVNHYIVFELDFGLSAGRITYDASQGRHSTLGLYCTPVIDITIGTYNFYGEDEPTFYPNNIDFPDERKQVEVNGIVTDAFGKWDKKYIQNAQVQIEGPGGMNQTFDAGWNRNAQRYSYTWTYPPGQDSGEYKATAHIFDEQNNEFTVNTTFTMADYGVLLTSPFQRGGEGSYAPDQARAERNVIQNNVTRYRINVWNIGNLSTGISISADGPSGWDWWLEGQNLTQENQKTGEIENIDPGQKKEIILAVDSKNNPVDDDATIMVTATCLKDSSERDILTTFTLVVLEYNVELRFVDGTKSQTKTVELGGEISYDFKVKNKGDTTDKIWIDVGSAPSGWSKSLKGQDLKASEGRYYVDLQSGNDTQLMLTLKAADSGGDETADIDIIGTSQGSIEKLDEVASDSITTSTTKTTGIKLEVSGLSHRTADPGEDVIYELELTNTGTTARNFTVTFTPLSSDDGWDVGDISFSQTSPAPEKKFPLLGPNPNNPEKFFLFVEPTIEVLAGNYTIPIRAVRDDSPEKRFDDETVSIEVKEFYDIQVTEPMDLELYAEAEPGEDVEYTIEFKNSGNVPELVNIDVDEPGGWNVDFGNASGEWLEEIEPQETETVTLVLTVPDDAAGDETVDITVSVVPVERPDDKIQIQTHTKIKSIWYQPLLTLLVPILLFIVIIVMVIVIYRRR